MAHLPTSILIIRVSHTLPVFLSVIESVQDDESSCRQVVFILSIGKVAHVQWIKERLVKAVQPAPSSLKVSIRIFITCSAASSQSHLSNKDNSALSRPVDTRGISGLSDMALGDLSPSSLGGVKMTHGRSDLNALLKEEAIFGSHGIARTVRHPLRFPECGLSNLLSGGPTMTLYVAPFGYA
ncbi:hypothetical protein AZE42_04242 [Rhizopogon vesiculosus]|uniref:Ferric reductase NAD binding domain-containing protein n=1 Tax=Rhizopogon vesiculosus TaxID=180088 RepID=A0A1J8QM34_9AGAM|nr:hypothetical protein AZE42_04242 [Rhizopogon vesiculosus]